MPNLQISLNVNYTIFDFGPRRGGINTGSARLLASNFGFNDYSQAVNLFRFGGLIAAG
jgi:hypothetical protein